MGYEFLGRGTVTLTHGAGGAVLGLLALVGAGRLKACAGSGVACQAVSPRIADILRLQAAVLSGHKRSTAWEHGSMVAW
eukprot:364518-Chlamydomonas_euryale.AAC.6